MAEHTTTKVRSFERASIRRSKLMNNLAFLKRCRDSNLIPPGLQLHDPVRSLRFRRILRSSLADIDRSLSQLEEGFRDTFHPEDFEKVTTRTSSSSRHAFTTTRRKQISKFSRLQRLDTGSSISLFPRAFTRSKGSSISPRPSDSESWRSPISHSNRASSRLDMGSSISLFPRAFTRSKGSSISPRPSDSESWRSPISHSNRASSIHVYLRDLLYP